MKPKQQNNIQSFNQHISADQFLEIRILDQRSDLIYLWLSFLLLILLVELGVEDLHPVPPHPLQPPDVSPDRRTGVQHLHGASLYCDTSLLELSRRLHEVLQCHTAHQEGAVDAVVGVHPQRHHQSSTTAVYSFTLEQTLPKISRIYLSRQNLQAVTNKNEEAIDEDYKYSMDTERI